MTSREDRIAAELAARLASCPSVEELVAFRDRELAATARQRIGTHIVGCDPCADALALLDAEAAAEDGLEHELPDDVEARSERLIGAVSGREPLRSPATRRWFGVAAAAAVLALVALGVWQLRDRDAPGEPVFREADEGSVASLVTADALPRDAFRLRWSVGGEVSHYNLLLAREDLEPVTEVKGLTEPEHTVASAVFEGVESGTRLIWQVEAVRPGGVKLQSATFLVALE